MAQTQSERVVFREACLDSRRLLRLAGWQQAEQIACIFHLDAKRYYADHERVSQAANSYTTQARSARASERAQIRSQRFSAMTHSNRFVSILGSAWIVAALAGYACAAGYTQTNLVTNGGDPAVTALNTDPNLVNPWGISFLPGNPGSPFWVSDNNAGAATLYDGTGSPFPAPASQLIVEIPSPTDPIETAAVDNNNHGTPTGQVANLTIATATPAFVIDGLGPALFIFATEDGTIEAWNLSIPDPDPFLGFVPDDAVIVADKSAAGAVYKGLALANRTIANNAVPFLYATNFRTGKIDVFNGTFSPTTVPGMFIDPKVQHGYAPFGIQNIDNHLWVTYALQDAAKHDPVNKPAHGFVSVFDTDGNLLSHFAQHGQLSSPWGVALAPASFGEFANDILIGNFGDGQINAYNSANGHWLGALSDVSGKPIIDPGLWSVTFSGPAGATAAGADPDTLYITAGLVGPTHELAGVFAKISPAP